MTDLTLTRQIAARPSIVFDAVTTAEGIAHWFGPDDQPVLSSEMDTRLGGAFRVRFRNDDGLEHEASGEILELDPPRRVVMSWRWTDGGVADEAGRTSRVEFEVRPTDYGAELIFHHKDLANEESAASHGQGWTGALVKLDRYLDRLDAEAHDAAG